MDEQALIGNLVDHLLDNYEVHLPPLKKVKETKWYEIDCYYLGERIEIYESDILTALQKWDEKLKQIKAKQQNHTGTGYPDIIMDAKNEKDLTLGQKRVRVNFNPSGNNPVDSIKQKAADLIDEINKINYTSEDPNVGEFLRVKSLAMTEVESAAHWAVKAATF